MFPDQLTDGKPWILINTSMTVGHARLVAIPSANARVIKVTQR